MPLDLDIAARVGARVPTVRIAPHVKGQSVDEQAVNLFREPGTPYDLRPIPIGGNVVLRPTTALGASLVRNNSLVRWAFRARTYAENVQGLALTGNPLYAIAAYNVGKSLFTLK